MTEPSDDLQQRFRDALPDTGEGDCPSADAFWAAASGELAFDQVRALVDHGARCARCAEAWRILADVRHAAVESNPAEAHSPPPRPLPPATRGGAWAPRRGLVPLAGAALAATLVWAVLRPPPPGSPAVERGNGATIILHAESPPVQSAKDALLRWSEVPGASSYNVTVLTPDLVVLHQAVGVSARELRLPESVRQRAGGGLLWNVDAVLPDGRTVASPTFELQLKER
jgi:hypothetical protein